MTETPKVLGIVVSYYPDPGILLELVDRLSAQVHCVLVVDNTDGADDRVSTLLSCGAAQSGRLQIARIGRNIGVAAALNVGISAALDESYSYVLLSDQDSLPVVGMVEGLVSADAELRRSGVTVGAVGPTYEDQQTGMVYPFQVQLPGKFFYSRVRASKEQPILPVCSLITSGSLISTAVIRSVGAMREDFFIDGVDWEWCHRATAKGYALYGSGQARMLHNMGDGKFRAWFFGWRCMSLYKPVRIYYGVRNYTYLLRVHHVPLGWKVRVGIYLIGNIYAHLFFTKNRLSCAFMALRGALDGIRGQLGELSLGEPP